MTNAKETTGVEDMLSLFEILIIIGIVMCYIVLLLALYASIFHCPDPVSKLENDEMVCEQMRKSGCSEPEIEDFMTEHSGYYQPPKIED